MSKRTILGALLPFVASPAGLALVTIGALGLLFLDKEKKEETEKGNGVDTVPNGPRRLPEQLEQPSEKPLYPWQVTVPKPEQPPFDTVEATVRSPEISEIPNKPEPLNPGYPENVGSPEQLEASVRDEAVKKEIIRQAMSELGKRSAAARAKKSVLNT
ncbi:hypothetical protein ACTL6U_11035 [Rhodovibrionaceae bacterium A322]